MTSEEARRKDTLPPEEGVVHPADELDAVNDHAPTERRPRRDERERIPDKRPTDGPI